MWCLKTPLSIVTICVVTQRSLFTELSPACNWKQNSKCSASKGSSNECIMRGCSFLFIFKWVNLKMCAVDSNNKSFNSFCSRRHVQASMDQTNHACLTESPPSVLARTTKKKLIHWTASKLTKSVRLSGYSVWFPDKISVFPSWTGKSQGEFTYFCKSLTSLCELISEE